jgi:hypothetical protein
LIIDLQRNNAGFSIWKYQKSNPDLLKTPPLFNVYFQKGRFLRPGKRLFSEHFTVIIPIVFFYSQVSPGFKRRKPLNTIVIKEPVSIFKVIGFSVLERLLKMRGLVINFIEPGSRRHYMSITYPMEYVTQDYNKEEKIQKRHLPAIQSRHESV